MRVRVGAASRKREPYREARGLTVVALGAGAHFGHPLEVLGAEVGAAAEGEDVGKAGEFALDVAEAVGVGDEEEHAALDAAGERHAEDGFEVEAAVGEERGDARHGARVILDAQFEHGGGEGAGVCGLLRSGGGVGVFGMVAGPLSRCTVGENKNPLGAGQRGKLIFG